MGLGESQLYMQDAELLFKVSYAKFDDKNVATDGVSAEGSEFKIQKSLLTV